MLVLWSGGCDSTLALFEAIRHGNVRAISIVHENVPAKSPSAKARDRIAKELTRRGMRFERSTVTISHDSATALYGCSGGIDQPQLWLPIAHPFLNDDEDLVTGWIRGDDVWHYRQIVFTLFDQLQFLAHKTGKLLCPLEWDRKEEVIKRLKDADLYDLCWFCEGTEDEKPCSNCVPCRTHSSALRTIRSDARKADCAGTLKVDADEEAIQIQKTPRKKRKKR